MSPGDTSGLVGRFLAGSRDRIARMAEIVGRLNEPAALDECVKSLGRDLHTLKGESRLLGIAEIEKITHASEDMLYSHHRGAAVSAQTQQLLYDAVDMLFACVQARSGGTTLPGADIDDLVTRLHDTAEVVEAAPQAATGDRPEPEADAGPDTRGEASPAAGTSTEATGRFLRVSAALLDTLTEQVSTVSGGQVRTRQYLDGLVAEVEALHEQAKAREAAPAGEVDVSMRLVQKLREFREHHFRVELSFSELSDVVRKARLQPIDSFLAQYPAFARRAARDAGKLIGLKVSGGEIGVDQQVLDQIAEPCLHLLRNAIHHGIEAPDLRRRAGKPEEGEITVSVRQEGESIRIDFADDGRGIDTARVVERALAMGIVTREGVARMSPADLTHLVFRPNLSTATQADEMAGRGVGLDVVAKAIAEMGGTVSLESIPGRGTRFVLHVPVTLSLSHALLVEVSEQMFALPSAALVEIFRLPVREIRIVEGREATQHRGKLLPLARLRDVLGLKGIKDLFVNKVGVMVLRAGDQTAGFIVDKFVGERELMVRPFGAYLGRSKMASGVTLMEDGTVVLVLHPASLLQGLKEDRGQGFAAAARSEAAGGERRVLYVEDSIITREYAAGVLRARGFHVGEASDGVEALSLMQREKFDIVLTDLQMPRMDGFKLTAAIRSDPKIRNIPIVVLSTLDTPETKRMALDVGVDVYIVKSAFSPDLLVSSIQQLIR